VLQSSSLLVSDYQSILSSSSSQSSVLSMDDVKLSPLMVSSMGKFKDKQVDIHDVLGTSGLYQISSSVKNARLMQYRTRTRTVAELLDRLDLQVQLTTLSFAVTDLKYIAYVHSLYKCLSSSSLTFNVTRSQSIKDHTIIAALRQCSMDSSCQILNLSRL